MAKKRKRQPEPVERIHGMGLAADHEDVRRYLQAVRDDLRILDTHVAELMAETADTGARAS